MSPLHPQDRNIPRYTQAHSQYFPHLANMIQSLLFQFLLLHFLLFNPAFLLLRYSHPASDKVWVVLLILHNVDSVEDKVVLPGLEKKDGKSMSFDDVKPCRDPRVCLAAPPELVPSPGNIFWSVLKTKYTFSLLVVSFEDDPRLARLPLSWPLISSMSVLISVIAASVFA